MEAVPVYKNAERLLIIERRKCIERELSSYALIQTLLKPEEEIQDNICLGYD